MVSPRSPTRLNSSYSIFFQKQFKSIQLSLEPTEVLLNDSSRERTKEKIVTVLPTLRTTKEALENETPEMRENLKVITTERLVGILPVCEPLNVVVVLTPNGCVSFAKGSACGPRKMIL